MKKILSLIATLCLMLSVAIPASAAGVSVSLSGNAAVTAGGTSEKVDCEISEDGKTLTAKLTALGDYAICKLGESAAGTENGAVIEKPEKNNTAVYIIIAVCAVVLIGGIAAVVIVKKKRA